MPKIQEEQLQIRRASQILNLFVSYFDDELFSKFK